MKQKVIQIGNSLGVIIPKETVADLKLEKGSQVEVSFGGEAVGKVSDGQASYMTESDRKEKFKQSHQKILDRYGDTFKELADK